jgi:hypothetical protein
MDGAKAVENASDGHEEDRVRGIVFIVSTIFSNLVSGSLIK